MAEGQKEKAAPPVEQEPLATVGQQEGFLARWSRRKLDAKDQEPSRSGPAVSKAGARPPATTRPRPPQKTDADMPPLDALDEHSDYSGFLSPKVSEELRKVALRKLFHLPQFNVVDGLDDYADDYTGFTPLGDVVTADMRYRREVEEQRARERQRELEGSEETKVAENEQAVAQTPKPAEEPQADAVPPPVDDEQEQKSESSQEKG